MDDEDERVTEFVEILSSAVEREAENKALRAQRDELLEALQWYAKLIEDFHRYPWVVESTLAELMEDAGKKAKEAIAKAKGERTVRPSPQEPDSFTVDAARGAIAKAKGE
jgi:hypothetical protein